MSYELKTRYIVIDLPMPAGVGLNIKQISQKTPKNFVLINGFMAISKKTSPNVADATVSVTFNNRTVNPIVLIEAEKSNGTVRKRKLSFWPLNEQVQDGTLIQGFVESDNKNIGVYNVKIIFRGKKMIKTD